MSTYTHVKQHKKGIVTANLYVLVNENADSFCTAGVVLVTEVVFNFEPEMCSIPPLLPFFLPGLVACMPNREMYV